MPTTVTPAQRLARCGVLAHEIRNRCSLVPCPFCTSRAGSSPGLPQVTGHTGARGPGRTRGPWHLAEAGSCKDVHVLPGQRC